VGYACAVLQSHVASPVHGTPAGSAGPTIELTQFSLVGTLEPDAPPGDDETASVGSLSEDEEARVSLAYLETVAEQATEDTLVDKAINVCAAFITIASVLFILFVM
jgi:hypothetical protein